MTRITRHAPAAIPAKVAMPPAGAWRIPLAALLALLALLMMLAGAVLAQGAAPRGLTPVPNRPAAPEIALKDVDGKPVRLSGLRGLPATFVIDPEGRVALKAEGGREFDDPKILAQLRGLMRR